MPKGILSHRSPAVSEGSVAPPDAGSVEDALRDILEIATEAFDDREKAFRWLQRPNVQTGNKPPRELIGTKEGFSTVETILRQIQFGVIG